MIQVPQKNDDELVPRLAPVDVVDPVTEYLQQFVDVTLLKENLKLTPEQRVQKMLSTIRNLNEFRKAGAALRHQ